ncbi:MAG TPA: hypothetical protein VMA34_19415 [Terracidiphilus sp.]|nr:hypothetical protein [Terracidiphilus sp.]
MEEHPQNISEDPAEPFDLSPKQSVGHKVLLDEAGTHGIDRDEVRELLRLLNAPPDIDDIAQVLKNATAILKRAEEQWPGILDLQALSWLPKLIEQLKTIVRKLRSLDTGKRHAGRDWLERNALYCALRTNPSVPADCLKQYRLLQAHYFFAHTAWLVRNAQNSSTPTGLMAYESYGEMKAWPALRIDPYHAGLCIRDLAEADHRSWAKEYLEKLPVTEPPRSLPALASVRMEIDVQKDDQGKVKFSVQKKVNYISDYLREIYGIRGRVEGRRGGIRFRNGLHSEIGDPEDPSLNCGILNDWDRVQESIPNVHPLSLSLPGQIPAIVPPIEPAVEQTPPEAPRETDQDSSEDDEVPSDQFEGEGEEEAESFGGSLDPEDPGFEKSPGSFSGRSFGAVHQILRQQKMFPFAIERLSSSELFPLSSDYGPFRIEELWREAKHKHPLKKSRMRPWGDNGLSPRHEIEALAFVMVMLWTGSDPERTRGLIVATSEDLVGDAPLALLTDEGLNRSGTIRIRVPFPKYKTEQVPMPGDQCECSEYTYLPDYAHIRLVIRSLAAIRRINSHRFQPFQGAAESYAENVRLLLKAWDPSGRLTINKITSALFSRVMSESGNDFVAATMITGSKSRLSKVAMHYACREIPFLQALYGRAVNHLKGEAQGDWRHPYGYYSDGPKPTPPDRNEKRYEGRSPETQFVARRLCPQDGKVQGAFRELIQKLADRPRTSSSDSSWIAYHNSYTFYTIWAFAMATGIRKLKTPYLPVSEISPINGVAKLRDKDGDSGTKTKLVWIPEIIADQMQYYANHLECIRTRFGIRDEESPCFFLTDGGSTSPVRPKTLFPWVSQYLPGFPVDIHRRFIFNALLDFGCPPEIVRIWMGHAVTGEEWWRDDATFSHQNYRHQLRQYLVPILKYLELRPLKGFVASCPDQQAGGPNA